MSKKHGTPPDPEKEPLLFPEIGGIEKRGLAAALVEAQTRLGKNLSDFLPWYFEHNPAWMENALREIMAAAAESLRDFIGRQAAEPIPEPFSVEFRFPVSVSPHSLYVEPPPELDLLEIPPGELAAFRERGHEISTATVDRILTEKAEEAAREGRTAPAITPEKRAELIRVAEESGEGLIAKNAERNLQSDLGEWFTAWRWAFAINAGWSNYRDAGAGSEPEAETLCLFHFPDPERAQPDPLWKNSTTLAYRLQTLQERTESGPDWILPEGLNSPEAIEGKRLFESLCPDGMISRLAIPITALNGETDPDKDTGERRKISFTITLEIHPLTFDFRGEGGATLAEPETYFPLVVRCDRGPGAAGWHELTPEERGDLFRQILEMIESKVTPETWDFPAWQPLLADTDQGEEKKTRKAARAGLPKSVVRERLRPKRPKLKQYDTRSQAVAKYVAIPKTIGNPFQALLPFDRELSPTIRTDAEIVTVGEDFTAWEQRVIDGMEELFERYNFPDTLELVCDTELAAEACGLEKTIQSDGVARFATREIGYMLAGIQSVSEKKRLMIFDDPGLEEMTLTTTGFLWQPIKGFQSLTAEEKEDLKAQRITDAINSKLKMIGVRLDPIWKRKPKGTTGRPLYYHRPTNLRELLTLAGYSKRSRYTECFLTWLYSTGEPIMDNYRKGKRDEASISIPVRRLAEICGLHAHLNRGDKKRVRKEIEKAAGYALAIGVITNDPKTAFDEKAGSFHFHLKDGKYWPELHSWLDDTAQSDAEAKEEKAGRQKKKRPAEKADEKVSDIAEARQGMMKELDRLEAGLRLPAAHPGHIYRSKVEKYLSDREKDLERRRNSGPLADVLREVVKRGQDILRGAALPQTKPSKPKLQEAIPSPGPEEPPPACDPAAAKFWKPFFDSLPKEKQGIAAAAVPIRLEETEEGRRLVLWLPCPSFRFEMEGEFFKGQARAAGFSLEWTVAER